MPSADADTTHSGADPAPAHNPPHDENPQLVAAAGVNVTEAPAGTVDKHVASHGAPSRDATMEPELGLPTLGSSANAVRANEAVVDRSLLATRVHVGSESAALHELLQPVKPDLSPGTAVSTTVAPRGTAARHAASHGTPSTVADTEPGPEALAVTTNEFLSNQTVVDQSCVIVKVQLVAPSEQALFDQ